MANDLKDLLSFLIFTLHFQHVLQIYLSYLTKMTAPRTCQKVGQPSFHTLGQYLKSIALVEKAVIYFLIFKEGNPKYERLDFVIFQKGS